MAGPDAEQTDGYRVITVTGVTSVTAVIAHRSCRLDKLARRVERLSPHHRWPERFHEDKSDIVAELRQIAREVRRG